LKKESPHRKQKRLVTAHQREKVWAIPSENGTRRRKTNDLFL